MSPFLWFWPRAKFAQTFGISFLLNLWRDLFKNSNLKEWAAPLSKSKITKLFRALDWLTSEATKKPNSLKSLNEWMNEGGFNQSLEFSLINFSLSHQNSPEPASVAQLAGAQARRPVGCGSNPAAPLSGGKTLPGFSSWCAVSIQSAVGLGEALVSCTVSCFLLSTVSF